MYCCVLRKFMNIGVDMLPPLDGKFVDMTHIDLNALTKGVHSVEALEMARAGATASHAPPQRVSGGLARARAAGTQVRQHLASILGGGPPPFSNALVRISKLQAAQVYAASVMFGYFLRRVDNRFQLEKTLGTLGALGQSQEESARALEELFSRHGDATARPPVPFLVCCGGAGLSGGGLRVRSAAAEPEAGAAAAVDMDKAVPVAPAGRKASLQKYVEAFDAATLAETARIVSQEGIALVERQTGGLFGSIEALQAQMQEAVGEVRSPQELAERVAEVVSSGKVDTLTLPYATQRRIIRELPARRGGARRGRRRRAAAHTRARIRRRRARRARPVSAA